MALKDKLFSFFETPTDNHSTSVMVAESNFRLDSAHYLNEAGIDLSHLESSPLSELVDGIMEPKLFTRKYCDEKYGVPYISSSEMSFIEPIIDRFISKELTTNLDDYIIRRGQILISAAGTVGSIVLAPQYLDGVAGTSDILRINCSDNKFPGFIYVFLSSTYGQQAVSNIAYGAIIKRVRGFQLAEIEVPNVSKQKKLQIHEFAFNALKLREDAHSAIQQARRLVYDYNDLPELLLQNAKNYDETNRLISNVKNVTDIEYDFRLDAHYYNPLSELAHNNIKKYSPSFDFLKNLASEIVIGKRFKRNYVESSYGTPFIGSKNMLQIRPTELKHLSNSEIGFIDDLMLKENSILIACSGTLGGIMGRCSFVRRNFEAFAGSQHILRIIPDINKADPGYLFAFLSCDYGYNLISRYCYGSAIDEIDDEQMKEVLVPMPSIPKQNEIGGLVRKAFDQRAEAIALEDKAQKILEQSLTK